MGISGIDTRYLTQMIRREGAMEMIASTETHDKDTLQKMLNASPGIEEINYIESVSTDEAYVHRQGRYDMGSFSYTQPETEKRIVAYDFGIKRAILNELVNSGIEVEVVPHDTPAHEIIQAYKKGEIDGVFLSNGPGDPLILSQEKKHIRELLAARIPMFGICLGHQMLSIAHGYDTYKLKFGHHGGNHPVKNQQTGAVEITAQNHNYNVPEEIREIAEVTHINLFDNTVEGVKYRGEPVMSVQHHPEASPGPHESSYVFTLFRKML
jgi:carbamoyl-phosphate synthase small subunit